MPKFTISKVIFILCLLNLVSGVILVASFVSYQRAQGMLATAYQDQIKSYLLADELRQSSDDLTRLGRTYVVTGDARYEKQYFDILDIRNGKKPLPEEYHRIYWDFYTVDMQKPRPDMAPRSLEDRMKAAGFTEEEFGFLTEAQKNSDGLVNLEVRAMNAVKGKFLDENGEYSVTSAPDFELARTLVHSEEYHRFKADIMGPLDQFYIALETRTSTAIGDAEARSTFANEVALAGIAFMLLMSGLTLWTIRGRVVKALARLKQAMITLSENDLDVTIPDTDRVDEIGDMARSVRVFKNNALEKVRLQSEAKTTADNANLAEAARQKNEAAIQNQVSALVQAANGGDFSKRLDVHGDQGFMSDLSTGMNDLVGAVDYGLKEVRLVTSAMADGDLSRRMSGNYSGAFAELASDTNRMADKLSDLIGQIRGSSGSVQAATEEILQGTNDLAQRTEHQAGTVEKTVIAMDEVATTVRTNAASAARANELTSQTRIIADQGAEVMSETVQAMQGIQEASSKISEIVTMIDEIAFQTNLLALNAAVEAARAGESGKGFAVVATEVRTLAQRSSEASREIKLLIQSSGTQIGKGVDLVNRTGESLTQIVGQIQQIATLGEEIATASADQSIRLQEVSSAISDQGQSAQQNAAMVEETTAAVNSLETQARDLTGLVSLFAVGDESASPFAKVG